MKRARLQNMENTETTNEINNVTESRLHPLLIPIVIQQVLLCHSFNSLKVYRQVCRVWNDECVKIIRNLCQQQSLRPQFMPNKLNCMISSENYPCQDFKLYLDSNNITIESIVRWAKNLHVTISNEKCGNIVDISKLSQIQIPSFARLKSLELENLEHGQNYAKFIETILDGAPACEQLTLRNHSTHTISLLLKKVNISKLTQINNLKLKGFISNSLLETLACLELKLRCLRLKFKIAFGIAIKRNNLEKLFHVQSQSLEVLELNFGTGVPDNFCISFEFPRMEKLKTFSLKVEPSKNSTKVYLKPLNLSFAKQLPVLKKIEISASANQTELFMMPCSTLNEIDLKSYPVTNIGQLNRNFPNVTKFHQKFSSWLHDLVVWQDLEELTLTFYSTDIGLDSVILGISEVDVKRLTTKKDEVQHEELEEAYLGCGRTKSLRGLSKLKTLRFVKAPCVYKEEANQMGYSELACNLVLLQMESLKRLEFVGFQPSINKISEPIRCKMRRKFSNWC